MSTVSLKENIEMVKEELNSEEQFFEKAVQTERFVKRYKKPLIGLISAAVLALIIGTAYDINNQSKIDDSNAALNILLVDAQNSEAKSELQSLNPKLYDLWSLSNALKTEDQAALKTLKNSKALLVSDLAEYELAALTQEKAALDSYSQKSDAIFKDLATVESAVLMMEAGDSDAAHAKLMMIDINSPLYELSQKLLHYGVK